MNNEIDSKRMELLKELRKAIHGKLDDIDGFLESSSYMSYSEKYAAKLDLSLITDYKTISETYLIKDTLDTLESIDNDLRNYRQALYEFENRIGRMLKLHGTLHVTSG